jgi:signal transduction histidine kinase
LSIRFRLTVLYTLLLALVLGVFGLAVYYYSRLTLQDGVDQGLYSVAAEVREGTMAFVQGDASLVRLAEQVDVFESATYFIVILGQQGQVLSRSANLRSYDVVLDPRGRHDRSYVSTVVHDGHPLRVLTEPLTVEVGAQSKLIGYLQVARLVDNEALALRRLGLIMLLTGLAALTLSLMMGAILTNHFLRPLDDIAAVALQITRADDLSRRLPDTGRKDEIGRLTMVLNQTLERLERLFHARQRFLADVSHELRTPLTTIRGNIDLMQRMGEADPEALGVVQEELERMTRLVEDLLLLARADTGGLPIRREPVQLDTIFLEVYRQVRSIRQPVEVILREVDQVCVMGDVDRLKQLILNLVDNAIKYTPERGTVSMALAQDAGRATIEVSDTGIGIPAEELERVFDRFYRVEKARSRRMGGSGLGLSIARWIAQAHGGEITVSSTLGAGSTFRVSLPIVADRSEPAAGRASQPVGRPRLASSERKA